MYETLPKSMSTLGCPAIQALWLAFLSSWDNSGELVDCPEVRIHLLPFLQARQRGELDDGTFICAEVGLKMSLHGMNAYGKGSDNVNLMGQIGPICRFVDKGSCPKVSMDYRQSRWGCVAMLELINYVPYT